MKFALLMPLISIGLLLIIRNNGGWTWLLLWPAINFLLIAASYALQSPALFGKRPDGTMAWTSLFLLFPYILISLALFHAVRAMHKMTGGQSASKVSPNFWLSRRPLASEIPASVVCIVDLTCEFPAAPRVTQKVPHYICLPTLDHGAPNLAQARDVLARLQKIEGEILIHCAQGHGRSAALLAAHMMTIRLASTADEALALIRQHRPHARFSRPQRLWLKNFANAQTP